MVWSSFRHLLNVRGTVSELSHKGLRASSILQSYFCHPINVRHILLSYYRHHFNVRGSLQSYFCHHLNVRSTIRSCFSHRLNLQATVSEQSAKGFVARNGLQSYFFHHLDVQGNLRSYCHYLNVNCKVSELKPMCKIWTAFPTFSPSKYAIPPFALSHFIMVMSL